LASRPTDRGVDDDLHVLGASRGGAHDRRLSVVGTVASMSALPVADTLLSPRPRRQMSRTVRGKRNVGVGVAVGGGFLRRHADKPGWAATVAPG
jgi:hypothetical protein